MSRRYARANDWDLLEVFYPVARNLHMAPGRARNKCSLEVFFRRLQGREAEPDKPPVRTKCGLVEAPGVEPGSEDLQRNGSTCVADRFSFAATHAHRLA